MNAQTQPINDAASRGRELIERFRQLEVPSTGELTDAMLALGAIESILLLGAGLVYLLQGWKIFKVLVVANAAILGAMVGAWIGEHLHGEHTWLYAGIAGAVIFGAVAWPAWKFAISIMGGLAGSVIGFVTWGAIANAAGSASPQANAWVGALIGLITLGLLAFVIFRFVVVVFTSLQGSGMVVFALLALLMESPRLFEPILRSIRTNTYLLPLLVAVPAVIGIAVQETQLARKARKKKSAPSG